MEEGNRRGRAPRCAVRDASRIEERFQISFWHALIVQAARAAGAGTLYTEELSSGQSYGSVQAINPFD